MKLICPKCSREDAIEDIKIPQAGLNYICPSCKERFFIKHPAGPPLQTVSVNMPSGVTQVHHTQKGVKIVIGLVCVLFLSLAGFAYYYFTHKKVAVPASTSNGTPENRPVETNADAARFGNISTAGRRPDTPPPETPKAGMPGGQTQVIPRIRVQKPRTDVPYLRGRHGESYEQAVEAEYQRKRESSERQEERIRARKEREEAGQYRRMQSYEECKNRWCYSDSPGVPASVASQRCYDCEIILR